MHAPILMHRIRLRTFKLTVLNVSYLAGWLSTKGKVLA